MSATSSPQPCFAEGACADPVQPDERGGAATGLSGPTAGEVVWTGYLDAPTTPTGELLGGLAWTATLASLRPAFAGVVEREYAAIRARSEAVADATHPPLPRWTLRCDRPGCGAALEATGTTDSDARRWVTIRAESEGWQISRWRDVPVDLCPEHREEGWAEGPPRRVLEAGIRDGRRR